LIRRDTDVRAGGPTDARSPRGARPTCLARLLLSMLREAPVVSLLLASSACVIPVVPEFTDPPAAKNLPPIVLSTNPQNGTIVFGTTNFSVRLTDPNPGDNIHVQWVADLQPNSSGRTFDTEQFLARVDGTDQLAQPSAKVGCGSNFLDRQISLHSIHMLAGDDEFDPTDPKKLKNGHAPVEVAWTLNLPCP
jgi:hypothetical protein